MLNTQLAILAYLNYGKGTYFPFVKTIKKYRGEIANAAAQEEKIRKFADPLPGIYILGIDSNPIAEIQKSQFDLLVITESRVFDIEKKEYDNFVIIENVTKFISEVPGWMYNNKPYGIDREKVKVKTLLSDARFVIFSISLFIDNLYNSEYIALTGDPPYIPTLSQINMT
jgi:hypothetical protein